jgi:hypothetical protein
MSDSPYYHSEFMCSFRVVLIDRKDHVIKHKYCLEHEVDVCGQESCFWQVGYHDGLKSSLLNKNNQKLENLA